MKKILSLILAGLMSLSCAAFVAADDAAAEATADPYQEYAISFLDQYGIYNAESAGQTNDTLIQRWMMALLVSRISTGWIDDYVWDYNYNWEDNFANNSTFKDVDVDPVNKYLGAISYANQMGIIEGYSATEFAPLDGITYRDALTMVCRTLGYTGLAYPWGYIQKAVELGLTEEVNATYTDVLTRGQVAVIIYNALFAPTKSGETLAKSIFDVDFGWENIVIVCTDEGGFINAGERAKKGYVGFKVMNDDLTLSAKTYFVKADDPALNLVGHEEELALGDVYVALFEVDGDLAKLVDAESLALSTVINNGITDNEGTAYATMPIAAYLAPFTQVKDAGIGYEDYLAVMGTALKVYTLGEYAWYNTDGNRVAIENATGNILVLKADKVNTTDKGVPAVTTRADYEIAWYYNQMLDRYYQYSYNADADKILINWMSDAEFEAWYKDAITYKAGTEYQFVVTTGVKGNDPYAKLDVFDVDDDDVAEIAQYKSYAIGVFSNTTELCYYDNHKNGGAGTLEETYTITGLDAGEADCVKTFEVFVEAGHEAHDVNAEQFAWINMADDVIGFKNEDGSYNDGVVLYNFNKTTGELEIVKYIPKTNDGTDKDSYWVTGILQGYSTKNYSLTIDGQKYYYGYDNLVGVPADMKLDANGNGTALEIADRRIVAEDLDAYLMQYVEVLVVDGKVVDIDTLTAGNAVSQFLVVLEYAGMTSDGYIAVYAYDAGTAELGVYKINSFNGWKKGDYRYYPENAIFDAAFVAGTVYNVVSYDAATDSYGVNTEEEVANQMAAYTAGKISIDAGYRVVAPATGDASIAKVSAAQKYIIIDKDGIPYVVVAATTGSIEGLYKKLNDNVYLIYVEDLAAVATGDFKTAAYGIGFVMYRGGRVLEAAYDDAQDVANYYLLGSTVSEVVVFNAITGKDDICYVSTNIDLEEGAVYMTIGNTIIRMVSATGYDFVNYVKAHSSYDVIENTISGAALANAAAGYCAMGRWLDDNGIEIIPNTANESIKDAYAKANVTSIIARDAHTYAPYTVDATASYDVIAIYNGTAVVVYVNGVAAGEQ